MISAEDVEVPVYCRYLDSEAIRRTGIWTPAQVQQKLEEAHPESESIKHAFRIAFAG